MRKPEPLIAANGDRYLNLRQAAALVVGVSDRTLRAWAEKGKTSFGLPLDVKRVPVTKHRYVRLGQRPTANPLKERIHINETNIRDVNEILESIGPIEPRRGGHWTEDELAVLEAKAIAVVRRNRLADFHWK